MNGNREYPDVRVARTRKRLKDALLKLLGEKSIHELKVKELAEQAGVNRVTFYDHYDSLENLLWELVEDKLREYERIIELKETRAGTWEEVHAQSFKQVIQTIEHIRGNEMFYRVMLLAGGDTRVADFIHERLSQSLLKALSRMNPPPAGVDLAIYAHWTAGGVISFIKHWLRNDQSLSDKFMVDQLRKIAFASASVLNGD